MIVEIHHNDWEILRQYNKIINERENKKQILINYIKLLCISFVTIVIVLWYIATPQVQAKVFKNDLNVKWMNIPDFLYNNLKIECSKQAKDIKHCLKTWLSIAYAESTWNNKYNYFWLTSNDKSIKNWVMRYTKRWYKADSWEFFYWSNWKPWKSHYCTSEESSNTQGWCPNWAKNFNHIYFKL
jgi:hypothetical protein